MLPQCCTRLCTAYTLLPSSLRLEDPEQPNSQLISQSMTFYSTIMYSFTTLGFLALIILAILIFRSLQRAGLPVGPRGYPYIGTQQSHDHLPSLPKKCKGSFFDVRHQPEIVLHQLAKKYGGLYSIWLGNQLFIILSDAKIVQDLLVKRNLISATRKKYFIGNTVWAGKALIGTPYGPLW